MAKLSKETKKKIKTAVWLVLLAAFIAAGLYFTLRKTEDFEYTSVDGGVTIDRYNGKSSSVTIPAEIDGEPVTAIGRFCFSGRDDVTSVSLPESLQRISIYAFEDCSSLTELTLPEGMTEIAAFCFRNSGLKSVVIPEGVTAIREHAFDGCASLESVSMPDSLEIIERYAFRGCSALDGVELPEVMVQVGEGAFMDCTALSGIVFPRFTTSPDNENDKRISVAPCTFAGCTALKRAELTGETYWIDREAFKGCTALEEVVTDGGCWVGEYAFADCTALKSFNFGGLDGGWVREYAFKNCSALKTVENTNMIRIIYEGAFYGCSELERIELSGTTELIGKDAFTGCGKLIIATAEGSVAARYASENGIRTEFSSPAQTPEATEAPSPTAAP